MSYQIELSDTAESKLKSLDKEIANRVVHKLESIKESPFDFVKKLAGTPLFSLRVGDYRVLMDIKKDRMVIFVMRIGHRSRAYNKL